MNAPLPFNPKTKQSLMKISQLISLFLGLASLSGSALHGDVTFTDDFNRANTTAGNLGSDWTVYGNGFFINSNVAKTQTNVTNIAALNDFELNTSFDVSVDFYAQSVGRYAGIIFSFADIDNYYVFRANFVDSGISNWQFLKVQAGTQSVISSGNVAVDNTGLTTATWYTFNVSTAETTGTYTYRITDLAGEMVFANGTISDSTFAVGGQTGFYYTGSYGWANDFSATTVPEPHASALILAGLAAALWTGRRRLRQQGLSVQR